MGRHLDQNTITSYSMDSLDFTLLPHTRSPPGRSLRQPAPRLGSRCASLHRGHGSPVSAVPTSPWVEALRAAQITCSDVRRLDIRRHRRLANEGPPSPQAWIDTLTSIVAGS